MSLARILSSKRRPPRPSGPKVISVYGASTSFANQLTVTASWQPNDVVYAFAVGRSNSTFGTPTNVNTWTMIHQSSAVGGTAFHELWRAVATSTSSGSLIRMNRTGNSVGWAFFVVVVRGADTTNPEDFDRSIIRPAGTSGTGTVAIDALSTATKPNCLSLVFVGADGGVITQDAPLQSTGAVSFHELGENQTVPQYRLRLRATSGTVNWSVILLVVRAA